MVNLVRERYYDMLIVLGEAPCPCPAVLPPGALLPDVAGRLPAGAGTLLRGDGAALHLQICVILNSVILSTKKVFILACAKSSKLHSFLESRALCGGRDSGGGNKKQHLICNNFILKRTFM